jgi:hypothetical protein
MKKTFFLIAFCAGAMVLFAQENNHHHNTPPQSVQHSWQKDYPNYSNTTWTYTNNQWHTRYQDRDHNNMNVDVYYDKNGHRVMSQSECNRNDLPQGVQERVKTKYHSENYNAHRIEKPGKGTYFQITLSGNKKVYLDEKGHEVKHY